MLYVRDLINSYILERVVGEFTWSITNNTLQSEFDPEYISDKYRNIFYDPEFTVNNHPNVILEALFLEINITDVHRKFFSNDKSPNPQQKIDDFQRSFPRSQDYIDGRLYRTPVNVSNQIREKGKLLNKCLISINHNSILFDCNYEQLTLILEILEHSIQFYPLAMSNNNPIYSNQIILPNFGTHSYMFSFNLVSGLMGLMTGSTNELQNISDKSNYLLDIISENKSIASTTLQNQLKELKFRKLLGYTGIYVNIIPNSQIPQTGKLDTAKLFFYVSKEFTQNSLILDRTGIMKSSLVLLSYVLTIYSKNSTNIDNEKIDQLLKDISVYTTSE